MSESLPKPKIRRELNEQIRECLIRINEAERAGDAFTILAQTTVKNRLIHQAFVESHNYRKVAK